MQLDSRRYLVTVSRHTDITHRRQRALQLSKGASCRHCPDCKNTLGDISVIPPRDH